MLLYEMCKMKKILFVYFLFYYIYIFFTISFLSCLFSGSSETACYIPVT
nr:MAG TPA: protein of unknown function (DUF4972) [Caudoviricetes sp.]